VQGAVLLALLIALQAAEKSGQHTRLAHRVRVGRLQAVRGNAPDHPGNLRERPLGARMSRIEPAEQVGHRARHSQDSLLNKLIRLFNTGQAKRRRAVAWSPARTRCWRFRSRSVIRAEADPCSLRP
jgi:hypothetical protein